MVLKNKFKILQVSTPSLSHTTSHNYDSYKKRFEIWKQVPKLSIQVTTRGQICLKQGQPYPTTNLSPPTLAVVEQADNGHWCQQWLNSSKTDAHKEKDKLRMVIFITKGMSPLNKMIYHKILSTNNHFHYMRLWSHLPKFKFQTTSQEHVIT